MFWIFQNLVLLGTFPQVGRFALQRLAFTVVFHDRMQVYVVHLFQTTIDRYFREESLLCLCQSIDECEDPHDAKIDEQQEIDLIGYKIAGPTRA